MDRVPFVSDTALEITGLCTRVSPMEGLREMLRVSRSLLHHEMRWIVAVAVENLPPDSEIRKAIAEMDDSPGHLATNLRMCIADDTVVQQSRPQDSTRGCVREPANLQWS